MNDRGFSYGISINVIQELAGISTGNRYTMCGSAMNYDKYVYIYVRVRHTYWIYLYLLQSKILVIASSSIQNS
jgi:hypothetical protein